MSTPHVGLPTDVPLDRCLFSASLSDRLCDIPAVVHLALECQGWGRVMLSSCAEHESIARACGVVLSEHPVSSRCLTHGCDQA